MYLFFYPYELIFILYTYTHWMNNQKETKHIHTLITFLLISFIKFHFFFKHLTATYHVLKYTSVYVKTTILFLLNFQGQG